MRVIETLRQPFPTINLRYVPFLEIKWCPTDWKLQCNNLQSSLRTHTSIKHFFHLFLSQSILEHRFRSRKPHYIPNPLLIDSSKLAINSPTPDSLRPIRNIKCQQNFQCPRKLEKWTQFTSIIPKRENTKADQRSRKVRMRTVHGCPNRAQPCCCWETHTSRPL